MKKRILAMLLSALLAANISACNYIPKNDAESGTEGATTSGSGGTETETDTSDNQGTTGGADQEDPQQTAMYSTQELVETLQLSNLIASALKNETTICNAAEGTPTYLHDYATYEGVPWSIAYVSAVDLDEDGSKETVVLHGGDTAVILREYEGTIYAYQYRHQALYGLRTDGTYCWNKQAGTISGFSKLQFHGGMIEYVELDRVENDGTENANYYISGNEVTQEEYQAYCQNQKLAEKAERYWWKTGSESWNFDYNYGSKKTIYPIYSSYIGGSGYILRRNDLFMTEIDGSRCFCIPKWEKYFAHAGDFLYPARVCGFVGEKVAWIFEYEYEQTVAANGSKTVFTMLKIQRDTGVQETQTISLPVSTKRGVADVFCNMLDENTGFLFVYGPDDEVNAYKSRASDDCLLALAKTTDGGQSWNLLERDASWYSGDWKDKLIVSHFFDENNGIIAARTPAGGSWSTVYTTVDGGKTWDSVEIPFHDYDPKFGGNDGRYLELGNFEYYNGEYILTFHLRVGWGPGIEGEMVFFSSTDLKQWVYIPQ